MSVAHVVHPSRGHFIRYAFIAALTVQALFWFSVRDVRAVWDNVPQAPSARGAVALSIGDSQFSYRLAGLMIQNFGESGGRSIPLESYDYTALTQWLFLLDRLDPQSQFTPFLAAYYFGAVSEAQKLAPLIEYLRVVGKRPGRQRWRWLAQAVYIARFQMKDLDTALALSYELADLPFADMPAWTRQMPAFILNAQGSQEEALAIMLEILKTNIDHMHPNEVNFTRDYICTRLLDKQSAAGYDFCHDIP